ncbi:MAG: tetratricopeptide repeat protein [Bacteroidota bacterium]
MNKQIERYLANEMTVREQTAFEDLLRKDPELMEEFLLRKKVNEAIIEDDIINLRDQIDHIASPKNLTIKHKSVFYALAAAIVIAFVVVGAHFIMQPEVHDGDQLFSSNYTTYPSVLNSRSANAVSVEEQLIRDAFKYYDHKNFKKATTHFSDLLTIDSKNHMAMFYLAISYIELENYAEAEIYLNQLLGNQNQIFWEQTNWYLSLVYLKQNKREKAVELLQIIIDENFSRSSDASKILDKLD